MATCAVLGATGNVGRALVAHLSADPAFSRVLLLNRREVDGFNQPKVEQHVINLDKIREVPDDFSSATSLTYSSEEEVSPLLQGINACFVTMGVGQPSKVSAEELERIDVTIPTEFAKAAKASGVAHVSLLTATGADINQRGSWMTGTSAGGGLGRHLKGKVEQNFQQLGFASCSFVRPGLLLGNTNSPKVLEAVMPKLSWMMPKTIAPIHISDVALVMMESVKDALSGTESESQQPRIFEGKPLFEYLAKIKS